MQNRDRIAIITVGILIAIAVIAALASLPAPKIAQAQNDTTLPNYFSYSCSQLESLVNLDMNAGTLYSKLEGGDALQIMQLKHCNVTNSS